MNFGLHGLKPYMEPYKHDCDNCVFVGWHEGRNGKWANIYVCPRSHAFHPNDLGTVVIRYSDKDSDYWSQSIWRDRKPSTLQWA